MLAEPGNRTPINRCSREVAAVWRGRALPHGLGAGVSIRCAGTLRRCLSSSPPQANAVRRIWSDSSLSVMPRSARRTDCGVQVWYRASLEDIPRLTKISFIIQVFCSSYLLSLSSRNAFSFRKALMWWFRIANVSLFLGIV